MNWLRTRCRLVLLTMVGILAAQGSLYAGVITYEEFIEDLAGPLFAQNLERTRNFGDGTTEVTTNGLIFRPVTNQNAVSPNFGRWSNQPVTYSHEFVPIGPVASFNMVRLSIAASSVSGTPDPPVLINLLLGLGDPDDPVTVGNNDIFLGFLTPGGPGPLATTVFEFSTGNEAEILLLLDGNRMDITITPMGPGLILEPDGDRISVRSSLFQMTYVVPEPATSLLLGVGLLVGGLAWRKRRGENQN